MQIQQSDAVTLEGKIKAEAFRLGFNLCGFSAPESPREYSRYENWLSYGQHAGMVYLDSHRHRSMRQHPDQLVPGVKTIISLGWPYALQKNTEPSIPSGALVAGYVDGMDYHLSLPIKMDQLIDFIQKAFGGEIHAQVFTDSAPILEREIASHAGLGWIGKNSCLISPEVGSAFLLAEIFIDYPLQADASSYEDHCGTCHRCIDACPTGCIQADRTIDSNRCISYLTIENKGNIPETLRPLLGTWLFGCDICQTACPWNKETRTIPPQAKHQTWTMEEVFKFLSISPEEFSTRFKDSSLLRTKLKGLQRNALIWLGNNGNNAACSYIEEFRQHTLDADLIECAEWAMSKVK